MKSAAGFTLSVARTSLRRSLSDSWTRNTARSLALEVDAMWVKLTMRTSCAANERAHEKQVVHPASSTSSCNVPLQTGQRSVYQFICASLLARHSGDSRPNGTRGLLHVSRLQPL